MMESEQNFEHFCRICTVEHEVGILIFSEEGEKMMLRDKITKYLHVEITFEDRLPKMICINCCTQLDSVRVFSEMACNSQVKLQEYLEAMKSTVRLNGIKDDSIPELQINGHYKKENCDSNASEDYAAITEMEVRIDPMLFLECQSDESNGNMVDENSTSSNEPLSQRVNGTVKLEDLSTDTLTIEVIPKIQNEINEKKARDLPDLKPIKLLNKQAFNEAIKPFVCTLCPRSFFSSIALQNHVWLHLKNRIRENSLTGKVSCPICKKDISTKGNLKVHMETHRPKGKHFCDICGRIFKTQCNLLRHKEYHSGEVYTCDVCGRVYPTNSTLRAHSVTHSDERPHNCPLCKKTFKRNQDLKFHINQHTGARPYRCPYCPKAFASSGNCFSHRKRMHQEEVEKDRDRSRKLQEFLE